MVCMRPEIYISGINRQIHTKKFTMKLTLLLLLVGISNLCVSAQSSSAESGISKSFDQQRNELEPTDQDEEELAQALSSLLTQTQEYGDAQGIGDEDVETLNALAEMQDEELEQALTNAIADDDGAFITALKDVQKKHGDENASIQDSDTPSKEWHSLINVIVKTEDEDGRLSKQGPHQLERERREATEGGFTNKLTETQNENDDTSMNAELEKIEQDKVRDKEALQVLANALAEVQQVDQTEQELENELASIQYSNEDDGNIQDGKLINEAMMEKLSAKDDNTQSQDHDEDIQAVSNEHMPSKQAAAIQRDENAAKVVSKLYSTAKVQWRRRRRWRRPTRIIRRSIRRIVRVVRKPIRKISRVIRKVRRIRKLKRIIRKAIKKIQPKRLIRRISKVIRKSHPKKVFGTLSKLLKMLKPKTSFLKKLIAKAGKLLKKAVKYPKKLGSKALQYVLGLLGKGKEVTSIKNSSGGSTGDKNGKSGTRSKGRGSWLTKLTENDGNSFLKKMIVVIKKYGRKRKG